MLVQAVTTRNLQPAGGAMSRIADILWNLATWRCPLGTRAGPIGRLGYESIQALNRDPRRLSGYLPGALVSWLPFVQQ